MKLECMISLNERQLIFYTKINDHIFTAIFWVSGVFLSPSVAFLPRDPFISDTDTHVYLAWVYCIFSTYCKHLKYVCGCAFICKNINAQLYFTHCFYIKYCLQIHMNRDWFDIGLVAGGWYIWIVLTLIGKSVHLRVLDLILISPLHKCCWFCFYVHNFERDTRIYSRC